jgi:hypothetical protein
LIVTKLWWIALKFLQLATTLGPTTKKIQTISPKSLFSQTSNTFHENAQNSKTSYIEFQQVATKPILMNCNKTLTSSNKTYYEKLHQNFDKPEKTHFDELQQNFDTSWSRTLMKCNKTSTSYNKTHINKL